MAETSRKRQGEIIQRILEILSRSSGGVRVQEVLRRMEREMELSVYEKSSYPSRPDVMRFDKIVRFLTIGPVKAGWMTKDRGLWTVTEEGLRAYKQFPDPVQLAQEASRLYHTWKRNQPDEPSMEEADETPGPKATLEQAEEQAWTEIESHLNRMNPYDFQDMVAGLLRGMKYYVSWVAPLGADKGVDIIAHIDPLGVQRGRIKVQVKRRADKIAVGEIRSFMALLWEDDVGIFVTTSGFTTEAEREARGQEKRRLMLLDARRLLTLWIEHYGMIPDQQRRLLPLRAIYYLDPDENVSDEE